MSEKRAKFFKKVESGINYATSGSMGNDFGKHIGKYTHKHIGDFSAGAINSAIRIIGAPLII